MFEHVPAMHEAADLSHSTSTITHSPTTDSCSSDDAYSVDDEYETWIECFLSKKENYFLIDVPTDYIKDDFNLAELSAVVPAYEQALRLLLDDGDDVHRLYADSSVVRSAQLLYLLIHQRFLVTRHGLHRMVSTESAF